MGELRIRAMVDEDPAVMGAAFAPLGWGKTVAGFERYLAMQRSGERDVFVATVAGDLNVLPAAWDRFSSGGR